MRVLLISPQPFFSERRTPIAIRRLAETLCADGHTVDLLTFPFGDDVAMDRLTIHRCGRFPGVRRVKIGLSLAKLLQDALLAWELWRLGRPGRYDVVHAVEESVYPALLLRWRHRASVIYDMDASLADRMADAHAVLRLLHPITKRLERWAIRSVDLVAPMCPELARYAATARKGQGVVVLHDLPLKSSPAGELVESLREAREGAGCLALYAGDLEAHGEIDLLVDAVGRLPRDPSVRVVVVGGPQAHVDRHRKIVFRRGLQDRIRFAGPIPLEHLGGLLSQADVLLSPRTNGVEPPLELYSYMDSGRAILATRVRSHTQVLDDSTALLVEPEAESFALGLLRLAQNADLRDVLAEAARKRVARSYSFASFSQRVRRIYPLSGRPRLSTTDEFEILRVADPMWGRSCRRKVPDRRSGRDRRSSTRAAADRRIGVRRGPSFAGAMA